MAGQHDGSGSWSQSKTRLRQKYTDDHGRRWYASIEIRSGEPTGLIQPSFTAPWYPDQKYLSVDADDRSKLHIDYDAMLRSRLEAHEEYHRRAIEESASRQWTIEEKDGRPVYDRKLLQIIGAPPKPIELIAAAMQGNSWVLGFSDKPDPRLVGLVPSRETRRQAQLQGIPDLSDATRPDARENDEEAEFARMLAEEEATIVEAVTESPKPTNRRRPSSAATAGA